MKGIARRKEEGRGERDSEKYENYYSKRERERNIYFHPILVHDEQLILFQVGKKKEKWNKSYS